MITSLWLLVGCSPAPVPSDPPPAPSPAPAPSADPAAGAGRKADSAALAEALDAGRVPVLVDVRTPEEFAGGHVPGAINLPIQQLGERASELERYKADEVWLICQSGGRSARAAAQLGEQGFRTVDVSDGTAGWRQVGRPVQ